VRLTMAQDLKATGRYEKEHRVLLPDGQIRWIASRGGIEGADRIHEGCVRGLSMDVTARKQLESEALLQQSELAHLSRVTMLGELSGSLAHELNQPLTAILANAQAALRFLARNPEDTAEIRNILQDIVDNDRRAVEVIRRLRGLLKKEDLQHRPLEVNEMVLDALRLMRSDLVHRRVTVNTELAVKLPEVRGDRIQLQQVLVNLLMNGCDAMDSETVDRVLTLRTQSAGEGDVEVSIADRGSGIATQDLERIFEPFVSTKTEGLGLGLAVCRTIVSSHDGRLWATNNADRGATLHFTLPAQVTTA
jgi:C4-dicarboxylate-specific signal transduction histidine kinase